MSEERIKRWRQALFREYHKLFRRYPWQWLAHLTFNSDYSNEVVKDILRRWTRELQTNEHIQIAFVSIICIKKNHPHLHILAFGKGKYKGEIITLEHVSPRKWESRWPFFAKIEHIESLYRATRYVALQTFVFKCDDYELDFYNMKLLQQHRNQIEES